MYCRYVDDVFLDIEDEHHIERLKSEMEKMSVLKFTVEKSVENKLPFLDIEIDQKDGKFRTQVYRKPTDAGLCMNASSECPDRYKLSVIRSYIRRAIKLCSEWTTLHSELKRVKQLLVNNGYPNRLIDTEIESQMKRHIEKDEKDADDKVKLTLFYQNQMSPAYEVDERVLKRIVYCNVTPKDSSDKLQIVVYYKNQKVSNLVMKNNINTKTDPKTKTNVIYKFDCPHEDCQLRNSSYVGVTTTTLSRRMTMHLAEGAPKNHMKQEHDHKITRKDLVENTTILTTSPNRRKLHILEAIYIRTLGPSLNIQSNPSVTLHLFG